MSSLVPSKAHLTNRRVAWVLLVALLLGMLTPGVTRAADDSAGFIYDISGTWFLEATPAKKLSGGDSLPPGATVYPQKPGPKTFLVVYLYTGVAETYTAKTTLPKRVEPSLLSRFWTAIHGHYRGGVVHAISRGEDLADGVVPIGEQGIDVGPLLGELPAGTYVLRLTPSPAAEPAAEPAATKTAPAAPVVATVEWDPANKQTWAKGDMAVGLYKVELLDRRTRQPTGSEAMMLACDADAYQPAAKAYAEAVASTKDWDEQSRKSGTGPFLQSYLAALADSD